MERAGITLPRASGICWALTLTSPRCGSFPWRGVFGWSRGVDLNHRPLGYEPNELPDCSTPQKNHNTLPRSRVEQPWLYARTFLILRRSHNSPTAHRADLWAHFLALTRIHNLLRVDRLFVGLFFQNFPVFSNQEVNTASRFIFIDVNTIFASNVPSP